MVTISDQFWGKYEGQEIRLFKMVNSSGAYVELTNYGAALVSVWVPDRDGDLGNVILGYPNLQGYLEDTAYVGSTIGRFANRIANASFELDGVIYQLENNDGSHSNHSGKSGFHSRVFEYEVSEGKLIFTLLSPDGDGGFPGNLKLRVTYQWTETNRLLISYWAESNRKTIANFTNHAYFNLSAKQEKIFDHELTVYAEELLEAGPDHIPNGKILPVGAQSFRQNLIRERIRIGETIEGLNTCYVLTDEINLIKLAAVLTDPKYGRVLEVRTSYPGMMLYTGDYLNSRQAGHLGLPYSAFDGLCLECQFYPDSPNHPDFPSVVLSPGEVYQHIIVLKFSNTQETE